MATKKIILTESERKILREAYLNASVRIITHHKGVIKCYNERVTLLFEKTSGDLFEIIKKFPENEELRIEKLLSNNT